jgi:hypothetical protein
MTTHTHPLSKSYTVLFHGMKIHISNVDTVLPPKIFRIIIDFLEQDLKAQQFRLNSRSWIHLFGSGNSYVTNSINLNQKRKDMRLCCQLVCKEWFLLASPEYPRVERLSQAAAKLQTQLASEEQI